MWDSASSAGSLMPKYAPYYCEENIWWLAKERSSVSACDVVFLANAFGSCAVFHQRAAATPHEPVIWDYHVVLCEWQDGQGVIWDLDSTLGAPVPAVHWLRASFGPPGFLPETVCPRFRVVSAEIYLDTFSSDRSHMRRSDGTWLAPAPDWAPVIRGPNNLQRFRDIADPFVGTVMERTGFEAHLNAAPTRRA